MPLVNHFSLEGSEHVSEWVLSKTVVSVRWLETGIIVSLSLRPAEPKEQNQVVEGLTEKVQGLACLIYSQALMLLTHRLGLDDPLQEAVVAERMALEQKWLQQTQWRDDRPYDNTAIPLKPLKA